MLGLSTKISSINDGFKLFTRERNDCLPILFVFRWERYRSVDMFSICLFRRERNGTISYRSTFRITFLVVPFFGTERFYLKCSSLNATLQRSTFRNNTEQNGHCFRIEFVLRHFVCYKTNRLLHSRSTNALTET